MEENLTDLFVLFRQRLFPILNCLHAIYSAESIQRTRGSYLSATLQVYLEAGQKAGRGCRFNAEIRQIPAREAARPPKGQIPAREATRPPSRAVTTIESNGSWTDILGNMQRNHD